MMGATRFVRHIALFRWKEGARPDPETIARELTAIAEGTNALHFEAGPALGLGHPTYDFAVVADFATAEDYLAYREEPSHRSYVNDVLRPAAADVASMQIASQVSGDARGV
jgi:hypothetical protein